MKAYSTRYFAGLFLSMVLAACGGGDTAAPGVPPVASTPAPAPTPAPALKYPIPASLWSAPSGATPATGNYVYLQSDDGDYIGRGRTYSYTNKNALITLTPSTLGLQVRLEGNESWHGDFLLPTAAENLQAGYFANLVRTPFDPGIGGVEWSGEGRACNQIKGWVAIDKIELNAGAVTALDLRFEQHCEGMPSALRGQIHWTRANADNVQIAGPAAIPAGLWQPTAGTLPSSGNYLYLESTYGDYIGLGRIYLHTPVDTLFNVRAVGARLEASVNGDQDWRGDFQGMQGLSKLAVGYYGGLQRYPFHNPVLGGMSWSGDGHACNELKGWFAVDMVSYSGDTLTDIDLRFEQYCDGNQVTLRGKLHWSASDTTAPAGPVPVPVGLWSPGASFVPPAGNYVYLVSDPGDYIGAGQTELLTQDTSTLWINTDYNAAMGILVGNWDGYFAGMNSLSQLQPGFYGSLQRYPFHNAAKGGLSWSGKGRACNTLNGWFAIDQITYTLGQITSIDLRFEQRCDGSAAALHGVIHWTK